MRDKIRLRGDSKHTGLKPPLERNKRYLWTSLAAIFIILAAVCLLSISPAMGQNIEASSSGVWTKVSGGSGVTGTGTEEVRWGTKIMGQKSGLRFDGQSVASSFGQEFCLGKLTHFNWPITSGSAANGATLQIQMKFTNPALGSVYFTYDMGIDETPNTGTCDECKYKPCDDPCPDKISWPSVPPANQSFELNGDTYTLQIVGIKDSCSGGNTLKHFITQEEKNNVGYLVGRIVLTSRPDAIDDEYETKTNVPLTVPAPGVLWNDFDRGGLPLTVTEYTQPANGQVVMNKNDGSFTYTPNQDFCGTDTFTYTITNGKPGKFDTATVKIVVVCDDGNKCTIDKCVNGVCTHTPVNCDDGNPCTDDSCDPATGNCVYINNIAPCDDGKFCTVGDVCKDGSCTSGTLRDCNDGIDCTIDSCNEDTDKCEHSADDSKCDDKLWCNGAETCDPAKGCMPGTPPDCNDGIDCTIDSCNEDTDKCEHSADDSKCDDKLWCNGAETCDPAKGCMPGTPPDCNDGIDCTIDSCNEDTDKCEHSADDSKCDDKLWCNGAETCDPTKGCQPGTAPDCSDGIDCTIDSCNEDADECEHSADDSKCDDGLWCNGAETCDPTKGCQPGTAPDCSDGIDCTIDSCNEDADECEHSADDSKCDDGLWCNGAETCDPAKGCQPGTAPDCSDGIDCTIDSCNEDADECEHSADDSKCDDDDACTIDTCDPLTGCTYEDVDCDDGDPCTEDSCDPAIGCIHTPIIPEAVDDSYGAIYGKTLTVSAAEGVLVNDVYDGSGTMTATLVTGPSSGTLSLNADGSFTYKPKTGFVGTVTFTYKACDGNCCSDPATVTIIVAKCPWTLKNDLYTAKCGEDKVVPASQGILANDPTAIAVIDPGSITINPVYGTIEVNEDGSFVYHAAEVIPSGTYVQFTYTATNGVCSASNSATAKIQIICPCR